MRSVAAMYAMSVLALLAGCAAGPSPAGPGAAPPPETVPAVAPPGQTVGVVNLDPAQAYALLEAHSSGVLLDVRTQAEFVFVGHPVGAINIPLQFWDSSTYQWSENPDFETRVEARIPRDRPVVTMCRSGHRSRAAADRLAKLGYARVYNMIESFEGDADPATKLRTVNGWKNRGLPWTYAAGPDQLYRP